MRYIILYEYNILPSTDGAVCGMFLSSYSCSLDFRLYICRYHIWTNYPGSHKRKATGFVFFLHYIIAGASSKRNGNAILRVPILVVVQLNLHFMCAT